MSSRTPAGFYFVSVCAAAFGTGMALVAGMVDNLGNPWATILIRAVAGVLACLSGVAAEALWNARPWAYRASLAYVAAVTLLTLGVYGLEGLLATIGILLFSACVILPIVMYVRDRTDRLFGPPRPQPRPAPLPRPVALGGRRPQPWW
jgi:uncharacterized membrane protein (DUF2068 family)